MLLQSSLHPPFSSQSWMAVLASKSQAVLNREGLPRFPHKINARARSGNGPSLQQERRPRWYWLSGSRCYLQCSKKMLKCSPVLEMGYPKLCNCICWGSYREVQAILYLFSIGCGFTVSLSKTAAAGKTALPYTIGCSPLPEVGSKPLWNWNLQHYIRLPPLLCILKVWFGGFFLINYSQLQFGIDILLQN